MSLFSKKPTIWIVSDGTDSCVQSWAIARHITDEKHIIQFDRLAAHSAKKGFPDLAIGVGYGVTDTLEGIKEASKGKTKIAVILDPLKDHSLFDFIILPSYEPYHVEGENVVSTIGLANYINPEYLEQKKKELYKENKYKLLREDPNFKEPFTVVLVGGNHTGGTVSEEDAQLLAAHINKIVGEKGGTALITTSARTEPTTSRALVYNISVPNIVYDYKLREMDNPYDAFLSIADEIIVTADSVRMMCEACSSGKKVRIYKPVQLGFQYAPLIMELILGCHAVDISYPAKEYNHITLNEAAKVGNIIKDKI